MGRRFWIMFPLSILGGCGDVERPSNSGNQQSARVDKVAARPVADPQPATPRRLPDTSVTSPSSDGCPVMSASGWGAWIEPGEKPSLVVAGRVRFAEPGYRARLMLGPIREIDPPSQEVFVEASRITGALPDLGTEQELIGRFPALPAYGEIVISCEGRILGRVARVRNAL